MRRALLVVALACGAGCQSTVLQGLDEASANDGLAALAEAGLGAEKATHAGRFALRVARGDAARAWRVLQAAGLGHAPITGAPAPWVLSPRQARAQAVRQRALDLQALLILRPDVSQARVALSEGGAAAVIRHPAHLTPPTPALTALIRRGAGLAADAQVALTLHPQARLAPPPRAPAPWASAGLAALAAACFGWLGYARRRRA